MEFFKNQNNNEPQTVLGTVSPLISPMISLLRPRSYPRQQKRVFGKENNIQGVLTIKNMIVS